MKSCEIDRTSLLRPVYRRLLTTGRFYAAFVRERVFPLVEGIAARREILDPMSGYGCLMSYCSEIGIKSYSLEYCVPLYLWQIFNNPANNKILMNSIELLMSSKRRWPRTSSKVAVSANWFPEESKGLISKLLNLTEEIIGQFNLSKKKIEELSLALMLPFVGRLSASVPGDEPHVKQGGMCIYTDWREDFSAYLNSAEHRLKITQPNKKPKNHTVMLGDCRNYTFPKNRFAAMITSPPYPNNRNFAAMFRPENDCLSWLCNQGIINLHPNGELDIGTNIVSGRETTFPKSKSARGFLNKLEEYKDKKRAKAKSDNKVYYVPFFANYFSDMEEAYINISPSLRDDFVGYIIVVNNTARNLVVPVAESIIETWHSLGFHADLLESRETFHIGTKNPRARGFKAKHTEHTIKVWR